MLNRIATFMSGFACSLVVLAGFYTFGFIGDFLVPISVDPGSVWPSLHALSNGFILQPAAVARG